MNYPRLMEVDSIPELGDGVFEYAFRINTEGLRGVATIIPFRDIPSTPIMAAQKFKDLSSENPITLDAESIPPGTTDGIYLAVISTRFDESGGFFVSSCLNIRKFGVQSINKSIINESWRLQSLSESQKAAIYESWSELSIHALSASSPSSLHVKFGIDAKEAYSIISGSKEILRSWQTIRVLMANGLSFRNAELAVDFASADKADRFDLSIHKYIKERKLGADIENSLYRSIDIFGSFSRSPERTLAHILNTKISGRGDSAETLEKLTEIASDTLGINPALAREMIASEVEDGRAFKRSLNGQDLYSVGDLAEIDANIADSIALRHSTPTLNLRFGKISKIVNINGIQKELGDEQLAAVYLALSSRISIMTGGPGTGKTTVTAAIVENARRLQPNGRIFLCAPTGKASKRLEEVTGEKCYTMHRIMGLTPNSTSLMSGFTDIDTLIIDEGSMVDISLFSNVLRSTGDRGRVLIVGDKDQLKSLEVGSILLDLLKSRCVPVAQLTKPHRFAADTGIVKAAYSINAGYIPKFEELPGDIMHVDESVPEDVLSRVYDICSHLIKSGEFKPEDIQVLAASRKGECGISKINQALKPLFNPSSRKTSGQTIGRIKYHVGDRIMYLSNRYDLDILNGDTGFIKEIDSKGRNVTVDFGSRIVSLPYSRYQEFTHCWAETIHKSQGSEYPCVIIALPKDHEFMLTRESIYTALTRGKNKVILIGSRGTIYKSVSNQKTNERKSLLGSLVAEKVLSRINDKLLKLMDNGIALTKNNKRGRVIEAYGSSGP